MRFFVYSAFAVALLAGSNVQAYKKTEVGQSRYFADVGAEESAIDEYSKKSMKKGLLRDGWAAEKKLEQGNSKFGGAYGGADKKPEGGEYGGEGKQEGAYGGAEKKEEGAYGGEEKGFGGEKAEGGYGRGKSEPYGRPKGNKGFGGGSEKQAEGGYGDFGQEKKQEGGYGGGAEKAGGFDDKGAEGGYGGKGEEAGYGKGAGKGIEEGGYGKGGAGKGMEEGGYGKEAGKGGFEGGKGGFEEGGYGKGGTGKGGFEEGGYGKGGTGKGGFEEGGYGKGGKGGFEEGGKGFEEGGYGKGGKGGFGGGKGFEEGGYGGGKGGMKGGMEGYDGPQYGEKDMGQPGYESGWKGGYGHGGEMGHGQGGHGGMMGHGGFGHSHHGMPRPFGHTKMTVKTCNKMMDGLLGHLQTGYMKHIAPIVKLPELPPTPLGGWGKIAFYNGQFQNLKGKICRGGDFKVIPQGHTTLITGIVSIPEPRIRYTADAFLMSKLKVRARPMHFCAKQADFRFMMAVNKKSGMIEIGDMVPMGVQDFHFEDEKGDPKHLVWPFNKIQGPAFEESKGAFAHQLSGALCGEFRSMIKRPEVRDEIISQV